MLIGYTLFDPLIVFFGSAMAVYLLATNPVKLMAWIPTALTVYFFIPVVTYLTLWQTIPLMLAGRLFLKGRIHVASFAKPIIVSIGLALLLSAAYAMIFGGGASRVIIRLSYYMGLFGLFSFAFEMGRKPECRKLFLHGMVALGVVLAVYGCYQIFAVLTGLPVRGILRGTSGVQLAFEGGFLRINSLANEPKRLGYVMFLCSLSAVALAQQIPEKSFRLRWIALGIFSVSLLTFAGSYFFALILFVVLFLILYPSRATIWLFGLVVLSTVIGFIFPDSGIVDAVVNGYERRISEIEVGLDGQKVYRQEFYAWDYLSQNPWASLLGVGLGQYYGVFSQNYGLGAGISEVGSLNPLNSTFLELLFDLSGLSAFVFYSSIMALIIKLRFSGEDYLCLSLLFVTVQSLTIITMHWMVLFAALGAARLAAQSKGGGKPSDLKIRVRTL